jgi:hypothetical protein
MELRFTQAARRHRIGKARAIHVIEHSNPTPTVSKYGEPALEWTGDDGSGRELNIIAVVLAPSGDPLAPDRALVIHVMPTTFGEEK